jgi:hypothetical protein
MIKMTYRQLRQINTNPTLIQKLMLTPRKGEVTYNLKKLFEKLDQIGAEAQKQYNAIIEKYPPMKDKEAEKAREPEVQAAKDAFDDTEFTIERHPTSISDLKCDLSVVELTSLAPILVDPETLPAKDNVTSLNAAAPQNA